jgi:hypothetical protein
MMGRTGARDRQPLRVIPWWWALIGVIAALAFSAVTTLVLLSIARHDASLRIEAIKVGLSVGAGIGGAAALLLAFRRQWLSEHVARDSTYDATERRVTELYGKAVEQLGHDKAAVRLGGLYSLERLAQDHREHRQTVVDVICAYLRMPFRLPADASPGVPGSSAEPDTAAPSSGTADDAARSDDRQELQVRLTAQRLLTRHLAIPADTDAAGRPTKFAEFHWPDIRIDLSGAVLIDLDLSRCRLHRADFHEAQFSRDASFDGAQFSGDASFGQAQFSGGTSFDGAEFSAGASFGQAQFSAGASFDAAQFSAGTLFDRAQFSESASFGQAQFSAGASFDAAQFSGGTLFDRAQFSESASFGQAQFSGYASFGQAQFSGDASFDAARFTRGQDASFRRAEFSGDASFDAARFSGNASFDAARFSGNASFRRAEFSGNALFDQAQFSENASFRRARFKAGASFDKSQFNAAVRFGDAQFSQSPSFHHARCSQPNDAREWPVGWRVKPSPSDPPSGLLVNTPLSDATVETESVSDDRSPE